MNPDLRLPSAPSSDTIEEIDAESSRRLRAEMDELRRRGIGVQVGPPDDQAYENPDKIAEVYGLLDGIDRVIEDARRARFDRYARFGAGTAIRKIAGRRVNTQLDGIRAELLYDVVEAVPWWRHGGSALALGTIVDAFRLTSGATTDGHPRMSGRIDESILEYRFDTTVPELAGMPLKAAVSHMYRHSGMRAVLVPRPSQMTRDRVAAERMANLAGFVHARNTESFMDVVRYCQDGIGIRERADIVNEQILNHVTATGTGEPLILSLGSGTTFPILDGVEALIQHGAAPHLIAVDHDPLALAAAQQEVARRGLSGHVELHCRRVFSATGRIMSFAEILHGRRPDIIENSGFREYVPDGVYDALLRVIARTLKDDGLAVNCCTNQNRPQKEFLYGAMGWPVDIRCCTLQEMIDAISRSGLPLPTTTAVIARSGVYTAFSTVKQ